MHLSVFNIHTIPFILAFKTLLVLGDDCTKGNNSPVTSNFTWPAMWRLPSEYPNDPIEDNQFTPNAEVLKDVLASAGVTYTYLNSSGYNYPSKEIPWTPDDTSRDEELAAYRETNGYTYADIVSVPKFLDSFWEEHYHGNSTIRYILDGSGYFDLRDLNDHWVRIHVKAGDFLEWPAGIYHRFTVDDKKYIKAMRLFKGEALWNSFPRSEHICTEDSTVRYDYINTYLCDEDPDKFLCSVPSSDPSSAPTSSSTLILIVAYTIFGVFYACTM